MLRRSVWLVWQFCNGLHHTTNTIVQTLMQTSCHTTLQGRLPPCTMQRRPQIRINEAQRDAVEWLGVREDLTCDVSQRRNSRQASWQVCGRWWVVFARSSRLKTVQVYVQAGCLAESSSGRWQVIGLGGRFRQRGPNVLGNYSEIYYPREAIINECRRQRDRSCAKRRYSASGVLNRVGQQQHTQARSEECTWNGH